jgi:hypothetical protein
MESKPQPGLEVDAAVVACSSVGWRLRCELSGLQVDMHNKYNNGFDSYWCCWSILVCLMKRWVAMYVGACELFVHYLIIVVRLTTC